MQTDILMSRCFCSNYFMLLQTFRLVL